MGERPYRIFGLELSPYSVKVRSYFRYKQIPHEWVVRTLANMDEFQRHARLPLIPVVVTPDDRGLQDSTPIIETLEAEHPEPALQPRDPASSFLSALLEEYADEWGNKHMFHYRWWYEADRLSAARRIAEANLPGAPEEQIAKMSDSLVERMVPRLSFVGSNELTRPTLEGSFERLCALLDAHLTERPFVFGGRPALADLGLWGQIYNASTDPTPGALLRERHPRLMAWVERMGSPRAEGGFEPWEALAPTLEPVLEKEVAGLFLPWTTENARALVGGEKELELELEGRPYRQQVQKYHARSLGVLRQRYGDVADRSALDPVLERTGCLRWLR